MSKNVPVNFPTQAIQNFPKFQNQPKSYLTIAPKSKSSVNISTTPKYNLSNAQISAKKKYTKRLLFANKNIYF